MSSSPFDDLLRELDDAPADGSAPPPHDEKREEVLRLLMETSKHLEEIAIKLDPTPDIHPLHDTNIPDAAKERLQELVRELLSVQKELNAIEEFVHQSEQNGAPSETEALSPPPEQKERAPTSEAATAASTPHAEPVIHHAPQEEAPPLNPTPPTTNEYAERLAKERAAFDAYKTTWDEAFAKDPALRAQHPEVQAYYDQMERYFAQSANFLAKTSS